MEKTEHWENVYQTKSSAEVSWYEPEPKQSLDLILSVAGDARGRVIDLISMVPSINHATPPLT